MIILCPSSVIVAIDKTLIKSTIGKLEDVFLVDFEAKIDCFTISACEQFIICCLSDGFIRVVNVDGHAVFSK